MQKLILFFLFLNSMVSYKLSAEVDSSQSFGGKINFGLGAVGSDEKSYFNSYRSGGGSGSGNGLFYTMKEFSSDLIECSHGQSETVPPQVLTLAPDVLDVSCFQIKDDQDNLFTEENCKLIDSCAQSKTAADEMSFSTFSIVPRMAGEDFAGLVMEEKLPEMERLEVLRKFAEKKYGTAFSTTCRSPFDFTANPVSKFGCDKDLVEDGYININKTCNPLMKSCFKIGTDYGKNVSEKESALQFYMNQKTDAKVTDALAGDNDFLEALAGIMSSKDRASDKLNAIYSKLKDLRIEKKVDPIFGYDDDFLSIETMLLSPHYEFFKKMVSKNLTMASAKAELEKRRRDYTKEVFNGACKTAPSYMDICRQATNVANGKSGLFPNIVKAASRLKGVGIDRIVLVKEVFPRSGLSDKDALTVLNAQRCVALGVLRKRDDKYTDMKIGETTKKTKQSLGLHSNGWTPSPSFGSGGAPDTSEIKASSKDDLKIELDDKGKSLGNSLTPSNLGGSETVSYAQEKALSDSFSDSFNSTSNANSAVSAINNTNFHAPTYNSVPNTLPIQEAPPIIDQQVVDSKKSVSGPRGGINDKIAELTKKLAATEDNLARMKEEREDAEEQKALQKKRDDDLQTITDLKKQISDLKKEAARPAIEAETKTASAPEENAPSRSIASLRAPAIDESEGDDSSNKSRAVADSQSGAARNASAASSVSGASFESAAVGRMPAGGGSAITSSSGRPLLVLSKSDGLSQEKIAETINDKIIELGGQSFEIEENGVKMEIVPEVKNGKILLDDKGKPRFVRKVINPKEAKMVKSRAPARVTDKADLKRMDEETVKRERAEYLKLKNITNQAVQKNN